MKPPPSARLITGHPLAKGLVGCWLMNEGGGEKVFDLSGNGNTGSLINDTHFVPGKFGPALEFDGDGDYVEDADFAFVNPPFTLIAWVKNPNLGTNHYDSIVSKGSVINSDSNFDFGLRDLSGKNVPYLYWKNGSTLYGAEDTEDAGAEWVFLVGTVNSSYDMELFVNANSVKTDGSNLAPTDGSHALRIGNSFNSAGDFNGTIDEVMIFNRALSASEIAQLYINPFAMFARRARPELTYVSGAPPAMSMPLLMQQMNHFNGGTAA